LHKHSWHLLTYLGTVRIFTDFIETHGLHGLISSYRNLTTEHFAVSSSLATETVSIGSELQQIRRALGDLDTKLNGIKDDPAIKETATKIVSSIADVSSVMREGFSKLKSEVADVPDRTGERLIAKLEAYGENYAHFFRERTTEHDERLQRLVISPVCLV
jgi:hypothetical protein